MSLRGLLRAARSRPKLRRNAWRLEGTEASSGTPLSVLCAANGQTRRYLAQLLFREDVREIELGPLWPWSLYRSGWARKHGYALVAIQADTAHRRFLSDDDWFVIPLWLIGSVALPIPDALRKGGSIRSELRAIRKGGLQGRVTREPADFDDFYHNMYVPHVTRAHGSHVYVTPYDAMRARLADSDLVLIHDGQRDIAGMMILYEKDGPRLWSAGVRDGDRDYLQKGALAAVYHSCFEHLVTKQYGSVSLGLSRAFLNDGILRYKQKWAQRIMGTSAARIALKVVTDTPASTAFLRSNPFVFERSGNLYGAVFLTDEDALTTESAVVLKRTYFHDGLAKLILFRPAPGETPGGVELPADVVVESSRYLGGGPGPD